MPVRCCAFIGLLGLLFLTGCSPRGESRLSWHFSGLTMGTTWNVKVVFSPPAEKGNREITRPGLLEAIQTELKQVNRTMSIFQPDSEISRFNAYRGDDWFPVSPELAELVLFSLEVSGMTSGAFDVTAGPLIDLWGFGVSGHRRVPGNEEIDRALARTGARYLQARRAPPALRKEIPSLFCNLSAVAKGYGVDRIAGRLEKEGIHDYMVEIGGEVRTLGAHAGGGAWRIGISAPVVSGGLQRVVELSGGAMATSGDYQNFFEVNGVRYSHTIDPHTGRPVTHDLASVTVVSATCMHADALATGLLVLGPGAGMRMAQQLGLAVLFIRRTPEGRVENMSEAFRRRLLHVDPEKSTGEGRP